MKIGAQPEADLDRVQNASQYRTLVDLQLRIENARGGLTRAVAWGEGEMA